MSSKNFFVIAHNLRSVYNVASIFRTADAAGVSKIYLTGTTPAPKDRFGRWRKDFAKVALGAEKSINWEERDIYKLIKELKKDSVTILALEQSYRSVDYRDFNANTDIALILGNEPQGIESGILKLSDFILEIPMRGKKESLNVAVAFGIAAYKLTE